MGMDKEMMQAVQVIIERLKTNPEDFFGDLDDGRPQHVKFGELASKIDDLLTEKQDGHIHRLWYLTEDEKVALIDAYREARRARFEAKTFHQLLSSQEPDPQYDINMDRMTPSGKRLMAGQIAKEFEEEYAKNFNPRP
jgi:hypothetical protein